jgi:hypothetical protein
VLLRARTCLVGAGATAAALLVACGPSFQVVYEGDARFEHCYALDDTPTAPMQEKTECWTEWMKHYTYGQTRNRVDYAAMRAKALREVHAAPTDEAIMGAAPGEATGPVRGHDEPVPTNAFEAPPKTLSEVDAGKPPVETPAADGPKHTTPGPLTPREPCTDRCHSEWQACRVNCKGKECGACDLSYGGCMKRCF